MADRILHKGLKAKVMSAEAAAALIPNGAVIGMSGFTGAGYPKAVPIALSKRALDEKLKGKPLKFDVLTGASTGPEQDTMMSFVEASRFRFPYQGDAVTREKINAGLIEYQDMHLSHVGTLVRYGYYGKGKNNLDFCLIEVTKINEDGTCVPSSSCGANNVYLEHADKIILEVNSWQDERLEGMHDIISVPGEHGKRVALPINAADDRKGSQVWKFDVSKVVAVVESAYPDRNAPFKPPEEIHKKHRPAHPRLLRRRGEGGPALQAPQPAAVGRRQHRQRRAGRAQRGAVRPDDLLHRGDPGRHARHARLRQAGGGLGHRLLGLARGAGPLQQEHRPVPQADHPAPAGDLQQPGDHPPPRLHRHERVRRGRHLRPRQLDAHRRQGDRERHRRLG